MEFTTETFTPDRLFGGYSPIVSWQETALAGNNLTRGTVVARDSGNANKLVPVNSASGTASIQNPVGVIAVDVDASAADKSAVIYVAGEFNEDELTFGGADTIDDHRDALRSLGIYAVPAVAA